MNRNERKIYENTVVKIVFNFCNHKKHKNYHARNAARMNETRN
jgi:hypothetical protein